jgi:hypothetical protein
MPSSHLTALFFVLLAASLPLPAIPIPQVLVPVTENFDSLVSSGTSGALPVGWSSTESGSAANAVYTAGTGSGTVGDTYSLGSSGTTERALGSLRSSSVATVLGASFQNATGLSITELTLSYVGEQWRLGALGRVDRLDFAYSLDGAIWVDVDPLDFTAPVTGGTVGALDGNASGNRMAVSHTLSGLSIPSGGSLWLRWTDYDAAGADDALAIDDFSLTARAGASPSDLAEGMSTFHALGAVVALLWPWTLIRRRSTRGGVTSG